MLRTARPNLSLTVPILTGNTASAAAPKSPFPFPISPAPINTPTARNTLFNQRSMSTVVAASNSSSFLQVPASYTYPKAHNVASAKKGILKRGTGTGGTSAALKKIVFSDTPVVSCLSPRPEDYHGQYLRVNRG